jgi:bacterioferritin-associated ferredoxin
MIRKQREFIEAVIEKVGEAKELVLPLMMIEAPHAPWTAEALRGMGERREELDGVMRESVELLLDFELPFLEEEERLVEQGLGLAHDAAPFEVAMVDFERRFWDARWAEYQADPERWTIRAKVVYDVCEAHRLDSDTVRRAIRDHGASSFEELAPLLGTSPTCSTCHVAVTRLLIRELKRAKGEDERHEGREEQQEA